MTKFSFTDDALASKTTGTKYTLSDQALGAVMMALQKSLLEQSDIVPVLKAFELCPTDGKETELLITNPPVVQFNEDTAGFLIDTLDDSAPEDS